LGGNEFPHFPCKDKDIYLRETGSAQQPFLDLVMNAGEVCFDPLSRDPDIDLFGYVEVPIQIKVELSFLGKPVVQITREKEDTGHDEDDEERNLNLQAGQFSKGLSGIERRLDLPEKMESTGRKMTIHSCLSEIRNEPESFV
jgi:hypothetical protein